MYWETYGFAPSDTVEFSVWVERYTPQGIARRFTNSLHITQDLNTPVVVTWQETEGARRFHYLPGAVPVIGRSVVVDVSALPAGNYWLSVGARVAGREVVRERREMIVQ